MAGTARTTKLVNTMRCRMEKRLKEAFVQFIKAFEEVFDHDWKYTVLDSGAGDFLFMTVEEKKAQDEHFRKILGDRYDSIPTEPEPYETFIVKDPDEIRDWHNKVLMLKAYYRAKEILNETIEKVTGEQILDGEVKLLVDFMMCFEVVLNDDWDHTEVVLGINLSSVKEITSKESERYIELKNNFVAMFGETEGEGRKENKATFLRPNCDISEYWEKGGLLLKAYHEIKSCGFLLE